MYEQVHKFEISYNLRNYSEKIITIRHKGGLGYLAAPSGVVEGDRRPTLEVTLHNVVLDRLLLDTEWYYSKLDKAIIEELKKERINFLNGCGPYYDKNTPVSISVMIYLGSRLATEDLSTIFSEILGVSFYLGGDYRHKPAYNSPGHTLDQLSKFAIEDFGVEDPGLRTFIYLNDPDRILSKLYTNIAGNVMEVPSVSDSTRLPGLYMRVISHKSSQLIPFYALDEITDDLLARVGIFKSKGDCVKGPGNTEKLVTAETQVKELTKELEKLKDQVVDLESALAKNKESYYKENKELKRKITNQEYEIRDLKVEHNQDKFTFRSKELHFKQVTELVKIKSSFSQMGEHVKAIATLSGVLFGAYKLFAT